VSPARVGVLIDWIDEHGGYDENILPVLEMVAEDYVARGVVERPVEFVVRAVQGLPKGTFRAVRDAYHELVEEDCVIVYGPQVSENGIALAPFIEAAQVPTITLAATEGMLNEYSFALPSGSLDEEPIIMARVAALDGATSVAIAFEDSHIGHEYLRSARRACADEGLRITGEAAIPQVEADKLRAVEELRAGNPDALMHVGFGLGLVGVNTALATLGWEPPRYTTTAFEFAATSDWWRNELRGWIGLDQWDERNELAQDFLDRFEAKHGKRPEYFFPLVCFDIGRVLMLALSQARPLTGPGVKESLERIKMLPASCGAPGTRIRFGRWIRQGWMGSEFLVARRVLPDGSAIVMHGTIQGLVPPYEG
jgi:ABC-type branched-subunit amino acid transport system substrate-binding protein